MTAQDLQRLRQERASIERTVEENQRTLAVVRESVQRYTRALGASEAQADQARTELRRAGLLEQ